jgi:beta-glucosidase
MPLSLRHVAIGPALVGHSLALPLVAHAQAPVHSRAKTTISVNGLVFKDLNANGRLDRYEDWRLPVAGRVRDLASRMTLEEKAGMLLINTRNAEAGGRISDRGVKLIRDEKMTRFVSRNTVTANPQPPVPGGRGGGFAGVEVSAYAQRLLALRCK